MVEILIVFTIFGFILGFVCGVAIALDYCERR